MRWCTQNLSSMLSYGVMGQLICLCMIVLWPLGLLRPFFNDLHFTMRVRSHFISNVMALPNLDVHVPYKPNAFGSLCRWVPSRIFTRNLEGGEDWALVCRKCSQGSVKVQWYLLEHSIHEFETLGSPMLKRRFWAQCKFLCFSRRYLKPWDFCQECIWLYTSTSILQTLGTCIGTWSKIGNINKWNWMKHWLNTE